MINCRLAAGGRPTGRPRSIFYSAADSTGAEAGGIGGLDPRGLVVNSISAEDSNVFASLRHDLLSQLSRKILGLKA